MRLLLTTDKSAMAKAAVRPDRGRSTILIRLGIEAPKDVAVRREELVASATKRSLAVAQNRLYGRRHELNGWVSCRRITCANCLYTIANRGEIGLGLFFVAAKSERLTRSGYCDSYGSGRIRGKCSSFEME